MKGRIPEQPAAWRPRAHSHSGPVETGSASVAPFWVPENPLGSSQEPWSFSNLPPPPLTRANLALKWDFRRDWLGILGARAPGAYQDMAEDGRKNDQPADDRRPRRQLAKGKPDPDRRQGRVEGADQPGLDGRQQPGAESEQHRADGGIHQAEQREVEKIGAAGAKMLGKRKCNQPTQQRSETGRG